jgi:hypothetical protein
MMDVVLMDESGVVRWLHDHAYGPDDIVLGDRGLTDAQLPAMHELLDIVLPNWRSEIGGY